MSTWKLTPCKDQKGQTRSPWDSNKPISIQSVCPISREKHNIWCSQLHQTQLVASVFRSRWYLKSMHTQGWSRFALPKCLSGMCLFGPLYTWDFSSFWEIGRKLVSLRSPHCWKFWMDVSWIYVALNYSSLTHIRGSEHIYAKMRKSLLSLLWYTAFFVPDLPIPCVSYHSPVPIEALARKTNELVDHKPL